MSNVGNITLMSPTSTTSTTGSATTALTQADFLQLMVAQFQSEDPLADDSGSGGGGSSTSDYVDQLMSMTNLTTMQNMSTQQGVQLAQQLPGQTVSVTDSSGNTITGVVQNTTVSANGVNVTINGTSYPVSDLIGVQPAATTSPTGTTSN
jgi:flagellar basal-body rod modification protein FlgD